MMNMYKFILFLLVLIFYGCAGMKSDIETTLQDRFNIALNNLEKEKYLQAQNDFKYVVIRGTGTDLGDDAQYYLARYKDLRDAFGEQNYARAYRHWIQNGIDEGRSGSSVFDPK